MNAAVKPTRDHVVWAYRLILGREPESEEAVDRHLELAESVEQLRHAFFASPEFIARSQPPHSFRSADIVIKELTEFRLFLDLSDVHIGLPVSRGAYELAAQDFICRTVAEGQIAIDIGSNIGFFAMLLAQRVGPEGHVYAFEPLERNATLLARSTDENGFAERVTLSRAAVGAADGEMQLVWAQQTNNSGGAYLQPLSAPVPPSHVASRVPVVSLDRFPLRRPISFMKVDAEGAELLVLKGARTILAADRPIVLSEINPAQLRAVSEHDADELLAEMERQGYVCRPLGASGLEKPIQRYRGDQITNVVFVPRQ